MSTPNPLIPQGTFQAQANKGASNVRIAVATIVAIHVVFFGGLLLQGCKRDNKVAGNTTATETPAATTTSNNLTLPPINSDSLYYSSATNLPTEAPPGTPVTNPNARNLGTAAENTLAPSTTNSTRDPWKPSNLGVTGSAAPQEAAASGATKEYTVARGDTYAKIAKANGTTVAALRKANPNVDPAKLKAGMKLQVPAASVANATTGSPAISGGTSDAAGGAASSDTYTVKAGDTLTKVAKSHNVTVSQLRAANNLKTSGLKAGQKLKIPPPSANSGTNETAAPTVKHTTKSTKSSTNTTHTAAH